jgi:hypothetical protein
MTERIPKMLQLADVAGRINIALESSDIAGVFRVGLKLLAA